MTRVRAEAAAFLLALGFLTRLPLPAPPGDMAAALRYLPAAGALIGAAAAAVLAAAAAVLPMAPAVLLSIAATCLLTGALHEDGLADTFDAIGAGSRERALEIMRDSRIGTFGALALGLVLALKATALAAMPLGLAAAALVAGHAASRFSCLVVIATSRYVRPTGTAGFAAPGPGPGGLAVAAATAAATLLGAPAPRRPRRHARRGRSASPPATSPPAPPSSAGSAATPATASAPPSSSARPGSTSAIVAWL